MWLALCVIVCGATARASVPAGDCPVAAERYSADTVLLDLLLEPGARSVLQAVAPGVAKPPFKDPEWPTRPPTFAAILTPAKVLELQPLDAQARAATVARLNAALARVPRTAAAVRASCERYDDTPAVLPAVIRRPAILVFAKSNGFRDDPSVDAAAQALAAIAVKRGWTLVTTESPGVFSRRDLARFDAVVWNNVSGDVLSLSQRAALRDWIEGGGGYAGVHGSGGDPLYLWDWYADVLVDARFTGHPMSPQFQSARVVVEDRNDPIVAGLGEGWTMTEEWYSFAESPRAGGAQVLATLDESSYDPTGFFGKDLRMRDHPIAWKRCIGNGRSFYTAIGHRPESYTEPHAAALLEQGIAWAAGQGATRCTAGTQSPPP